MKEEIVFVGYSGHAYVCVDVAFRLGKEVSGYFDISQKEVNPFKLIYLGSENECQLKSDVFVSVGDNNIRKKIISNLDFSNLVSLIDPSAIVSSTVTIQKGVLVAPNATVNAFSEIGKGAIINTGSIVEHECKIGNFAHVCPGSVLAGNVEIGECTFIGANSTVIQGVKICDNVILGANSTVINDIHESGVYVGSPAKKIK